MSGVGDGVLGWRRWVGDVGLEAGMKWWCCFNDNIHACVKAFELGRGWFVDYDVMMMMMNLFGGERLNFIYNSVLVHGRRWRSRVI